MTSHKIYPNNHSTISVKRNRKSSVLKNPGMFALFLYLGAWYINDPIAIPIGKFNITPTQIAIILGILVVSLSHRTIKPTAEFRRVSRWLVLYLIVSFFSMVHVYVVYGTLSLTIVSMMMNVLWFIVVGRYLSEGISKQEWLFVARLFLFFGVVAIISGLLELAKGDFLITTGSAMQSGILPGQFWIRGLHADKVNFATSIFMLALVVIGYLLSEEIGGFAKLIMMVLLLIIGALMVLSASWTGMIGSVIALAIIFTSKLTTKNRIVFFVLIVSSMMLLWYWLPQLYSFNSLAQFFEAKYDRQVINYDSYNFRYMSTIAGLEIFYSSPIFGIGFGRSGQALMAVLNLYKPIVPHTAFINVLLEQGLVGFIPFLGWLVTVYYLFIGYWLGRNENINIPFVMQVWLIGMSAFLLARFIAYFHYLDVTIYFVWSLLLVTGLSSKDLALNK